MPGYHFNRQTGLVGRCRAVRRCPFGDLVEDHYATPEEARKAYEQDMASHLLPKSSWNADMKLMNADDLAQEVLSRLSAQGASLDEYDEVLELASFLHAKQKRRNRHNHETTPYIEHPLRASLRLMRAGVTDEVIIKACLLHDTVEDGSFIFHSSMRGQKAPGEEKARAVLLSYIATHHGEEVAKVVAGVTNDLPPGGNPSPAEKNESYRRHLEEAVRSDQRILLVKLSDFIDNAGSLHHTDVAGQEEKTLKQATKYLPCVAVFREELQRRVPYLPPASQEAYQEQMVRIEERLRGLCTKYGPTSSA